MIVSDSSTIASTSGPVGAVASPPSAVLSIDIEDWFQVENLKSVISAHSWHSRELRVERSTDRMLELMEQRGVRATCFILGWIAEACPDLVRRISDAGHEVASHGHGHELVYRLSKTEFRQDVLRSVGVLEDLTGKAVLGYRAPSFSITDWAIDILADVGLRYDSSAFPTVGHDRYGSIAGIDVDSRVVELRPGFLEVCVSSLKMGNRAIPWGGGGYFRLLPYPVFKRGVDRILAGGGSYVFYIHPWEIDAGQPRVRGLGALYRFRHYNNLHRCEDRFSALLNDFRWTRICDMISA